ncbi:MAG: type VI secretion system baseplate subunit TssG [Pirellulales bacterium]|jgi:type VI secretion system protein ImpH|nr:type VI secretion system baseplate subunit TssG [Thermoguttaceae bacterium]MDD4788142.1 type VI secretion system baseplate subunit TssG [Pirellulales bacterium]MDI9442769.1 type VI secretion system baseplate subunit TssG [Planctomycetota bacterium]NLZ01338.1 type VI secretion system baseplate subunit TssG [Pirellulaceae bacterium]
MATASRRDGAPLGQQLLEEPHAFDFFQAVRLLERLAHADGPRGAARAEPVGYDYDPKTEAVRFRAFPSHRFPAGEIHQIKPPPAAGEAVGPRGAEITVAFIGLTGPCGVLPAHYTSLLLERIREKDFALRDFLDLFHHRLVSLFYRAWEKYRFYAVYERAEIANAPENADLLTAGLLSLVGLGTGGLRNRMAFDDQAFLFYGGHFSRRVPAAVSLEQIVGDDLGLPASVRQFLGRWLYLGREDQSALPSPKLPEGLNNQLGASVLLGERVWDAEGKFRVRLGPMTRDRFRQFLPDGPLLRPLSQMIRAYVGPQFDFDVQPVLAGAEVPWCVLGGKDADAPRLGWNIWIRSRPFARDVSDAVFSLEGESWITES